MKCSDATRWLLRHCNESDLLLATNDAHHDSTPGNRAKILRLLRQHFPCISTGALPGFVVAISLAVAGGGSMHNTRVACSNAPLHTSLIQCTASQQMTRPPSPQCCPANIRLPSPHPRHQPPQTLRCDNSEEIRCFDVWCQ